MIRPAAFLTSEPHAALTPTSDLSKRLLLVDDEDAIRIALSRFLRARGR